MRRLITLGSLAVALLLTLTLAPAAPSGAAPDPRNPLAGTGPWLPSMITTAANPELRNHLAENDPARKALLAKIALTPRVRWFANCASCNVATVQQTVAAYVEDARRDNPDALVQLAIFGLWPDGEVVDGKRPRMSWSMVRYRQWIKQIVAGIGDARTAIVLEPDLAISANHGDDGRTMRDPSARTRMRMAAWAATYLSRTLHREAIYLDAGSADWLTVDEAVRLLKASGVKHVRGFALGATHYDSTADNVAYAARISAALKRAGIKRKHAVIDTADNGRPFTWSQWNARWGERYRSTGNLYYQFDNTPACGSRRERVCQTLGQAPTTRMVGRQARRYVDAYLWFGRGWRWMQQGGNDPHTLERSIAMATYTRFTH